MKHNTVAPSSADRVKAYLNGEFLRPELEAGTRLPPVRTVARQLGVSSATVQQAYRELTDEGKIISGVGRGTFLVEQPKQNMGRPICLGLSIVPLPAPRHDNMWGFQVSQSILTAAAKNAQSVTILPLSPRDSGTTTFAEILSEERHLVDGLIVFPLPQADLASCRHVIDRYEKSGKPVVSIFPDRLNATQSFVSPDFFQMGKIVAQTVAQAGRKKLLFLCSSKIHTSMSTQLRLAGLMEGFSENGLDPLECISIVEAGSVRQEDGANAVSTALSSGARFDCIFSFGPFLAAGAINALEAAKISMPDDVSVITDSFMTPTSAGNQQISSLVQPIKALGESLIEMSLQRINSPKSDCSGRYLPISFASGNTLSEEEERILVSLLP